VQIILALRYFLQTLSSPDPLAQQYGSRRRAGQSASGAGGSGVINDTGMWRADRSDREAHQAQNGAGGGLSRVSSDLGGFDTRYVDASRPSTGGNRYRTHSTASTGTATQPTLGRDSRESRRGGDISNRGNLRAFVSTHLSSAAADEVQDEAEEELIDTITADLLSSRDRNRGSTSAGNNAATRGNTGGEGGGDNSHLYMNTTLNRQSSNNTNARGLRASTYHSNNNTHYRAGGARPGDWDLNYSTPPRTASSTPRSSASSARHTHNASPGSVGSPRGVRGSVRDTHGTATPSSTSSSGAHSYSRSERSEQDSDSAEADADVNELETVFQNDFFNRFFPFLSRKGSTFGSEEHSGGNKKKNR